MSLQLLKCSWWWNDMLCQVFSKEKKGYMTKYGKMLTSVWSGQCVFTLIFFQLLYNFQISSLKEGLQPLSSTQYTSLQRVRARNLFPTSSLKIIVFYKLGRQQSHLRTIRNHLLCPPNSEILGFSFLLRKLSFNTAHKFICSPQHPTSTGLWTCLLKSAGLAINFLSACLSLIKLQKKGDIFFLHSPQPHRGHCVFITPITIFICIILFYMIFPYLFSIKIPERE